MPKIQANKVKEVEFWSCWKADVLKHYLSNET